MSWKRTWVWCNNAIIGDLDLGPLSAEEKKTSVPTTTRYKDKTGRTRFKGNGTLKQSQFLGFRFVKMICEFWTYSSSGVLLKISLTIIYIYYIYYIGSLVLTILCPLLLRTYTYKFAAKLVRMIPKLRDGRHSRQKKLVGQALVWYKTNIPKEPLI